MRGRHAIVSVSIARRRPGVCPLAATAVASFALLLAAASAARGGDGVLEINQDCAAGTGCFEHDLPGFPVEIAVPGSFVLTGNLTVADKSTSAIFVAADGVTLDLGGFTVEGPVQCSGTPVNSCAPTGGSASGVDVQGVDVTVMNGSIRGFTKSGVLAPERTLVERVAVAETGSVGIHLGESSIVRGCRSSRNDAAGFQVGLGSTVEDSTAVGNRYVGFNSLGGSVFRSCGARTNGNHGFKLGANDLLLHSTASGNYAYGAWFGTGDLGGYGHCTFFQNNGSESAPQVERGVEIAPNLCGGDTTCP